MVKLPALTTQSATLSNNCHQDRSVNATPSNHRVGKVKVKSSISSSLPVENLLPQNMGSIVNYCSNVLKQPNGELLVAVNHNQLRTMASETVDPIDWSHSPPSWAVPLSATCIVKSVHLSGTRTCNAACEATTLPMRPLRVIESLFQGIIRSNNLRYFTEMIMNAIKVIPEYLVVR